MGFVVDLTDPDTDVEDVRTVVDRTVDDDSVLEAMYQIFEYGFDQSESISDEVLETLLEYGDDNGLTDGASTVGEMRTHLDTQRDKIASNPRLKNMFSELLKITRYLFIGEGKKEALVAQKEGIANDWDLNVTIPVI